MSLRQEKKARTRQALIAAGLLRFLRDGFDETPVDLIAADVGISRRTLFRYFETKEDLFFARSSERLERFEGFLNSGDPDATPFGRVRSAMLAVADDYTAAREQLIAQHHAIQASRALIAHDLKLDREWERVTFVALIEDPNDAGCVFRARLLSGALIGMIRATLREWIEDGAVEPLRPLGLAGFELLVDGFGLGDEG